MAKDDTRTPLDGHPDAPAGAGELAALAESLLDEVAEVRRRYEELDRLLRSLRPPALATRGVDRRRSDRKGRDRAADRQLGLGAARSIARTAALSGASRHEIEVYLRDELGLADSAAALDDIFGREAASEQRGR